MSQAATEHLAMKFILIFNWHYENELNLFCFY